MNRFVKNGWTIARCFAVAGLMVLGAQTLRAETIDEVAESRRLIFFPSNEVFRGLLADPKELRFFMGVGELDTPTQDFTAWSVGLGEYLGLVRLQGSEPTNGWQLNLLAGVFSLFNLDAPSVDLINTDFVAGASHSFRWGFFSFRNRFFHQSSHLGDEFILSNAPNRINLSFEATDALFSLELGGFRTYGGGTYLLNREPETLDRRGAQGGLEYYSGTSFWNFMRLVAGVDVKAWEEQKWRPSYSAKIGPEFGNPDLPRRRFRLLAEYYDGFATYGQFYQDKVTYAGLGAHLSF